MLPPQCAAADNSANRTIETAKIYGDGETEDWRTNPYPMNLSTKQVTRDKRLSLSLAPGGGAAIALTPIE